MRLVIGIAAIGLLAAPASAGSDAKSSCFNPEPREEKTEREEKREAQRERDRAERAKASTGCRRDPLTQACSLGASPFASF
ncbi:hypothetical protein [Sphingomicrobium aestuariivivum]|uniref:hypothetical protein n=1 Tax=Sphingomicrobium aestuariivivum TaxID=1582356 RepID=UPI001FD6A7F6|nr:hypothetical protein [Sphingomicrobium aestuariivivum]MCJ8190366.1 hypothetical protein [Sphingomicrobium aestuariivivum]